MGEFGKQLVDLHLLKSNDLETPLAKLSKGSNKVEKVAYQDWKVWISEDQYFDGVAEEVWKWKIGGYQVCAKWLKDRKGRPLSLDEIRHYCKIVTAIGKTIEIQKEIDDLYPGIEKNKIDFSNIVKKE